MFVLLIFKCGVISVIDWFVLLVFIILGGIFWLLWIVKMMGFLF